MYINIFSTVAVYLLSRLQCLQQHTGELDAEIPQAREYGFWYNEGPIIDKYEALDLLARESPTYEPNHLSKNYQLGVWEIIVPRYSHGDSGGDQSGYYYFQINETLAEELVASAVMMQREIKLEHGFYKPRGEFVLSEAGKTSISGHRQTQREKARSMLVLGVHTDLTGEILHRGNGDREELWYGALYFDFFHLEGLYAASFLKPVILNIPLKGSY